MSEHGSQPAFSPAGSDTLSIVGNQSDYVIESDEYGHAAHAQHRHMTPAYQPNEQEQQQQQQQQHQQQQHQQHQQLQVPMTPQPQPTPMNVEQQPYHHQVHHMYPNMASAGTNVYNLVPSTSSTTPSYTTAAFLPKKPISPANKVQVYLATQTMEGKTRYTSLISKIFPPGRTNCHLSTTFYDHVKDTVLKEIKQIAPYSQILKSGFTIDLIRPVVSYKHINSIGSMPFHFNPPITNDIKAMAPSAAIELDNKHAPFISLNIYYNLALVKPNPDRFVISNDDKKWLESILNQAKEPKPTNPEAAPTPTGTIKSRIGVQQPEFQYKRGVQMSNRLYRPFNKARSWMSTKRVPYRRGQYTPTPTNDRRQFRVQRQEEEEEQMEDEYDPNNPNY